MQSNRPHTACTCHWLHQILHDTCSWACMPGLARLKWPKLALI